MRSFPTLLVGALYAGISLAQNCTLTPSGGDDAPAFLEAAQSCGTVSIPETSTLNISTRMNMTGLQDTHIDLKGTIRFEPDIDYWSGNSFTFFFQNTSTFWLLGGQNITLDGGGTLDGVGDPWYTAFDSNSSLQRPITLTLFQATDAVVKDIQMVDAPFWNNLVNEGQNILYDNITITAHTDGSAHNTDGWDTYRSDNVTIQNSVINNGDDCVSFKPNSTNIFVSNLNCNGSHGISVGSLGQYPQFFDIVENVTSVNVKMANAQNGARIKAWAGINVGSGNVKNITFLNFTETAVDNPIIIDQCYMTNASACAANPSNTFIEDVWFNSISGTGTQSVVASISCSPDGRCSDVNVNDISLTFPSGNTTYTCQNVNLTGNAASLFPECTVT